MSYNVTDFKIDDYLSNHDITRNQLNEFRKALRKSQPKTAILEVIYHYNQINLKRLSHILGKSASTVHKHLGDLLEDGLIELANSIKGKYYKVTNLYIAILKDEQEVFENQDFDTEIQRIRASNYSQLYEKSLDKLDQSEEERDLAINFRAIFENGLFTSNILNQIAIVEIAEKYFHLELISILRNIKRNGITEKSIVRVTDAIESKNNPDLAREFDLVRNSSTDVIIDFIVDQIADKKFRSLLIKSQDDDLDPDEYRSFLPLGNISFTTTELKIATVDQLACYIEMLLKFYRDLNKLKNQFEKENKEVDQKFISRQFVHMFTIPMSSPEQNS